MVGRHPPRCPGCSLAGRPAWSGWSSAVGSHPPRCPGWSLAGRTALAGRRSLVGSCPPGCSGCCLAGRHAWAQRRSLLGLQPCAACPRSGKRGPLHLWQEVRFGGCCSSSSSSAASASSSWEAHCSPAAAGSGSVASHCKVGSHRPRCSGSSSVQACLASEGLEARQTVGQLQGPLLL